MTTPLGLEQLWSCLSAQLITRGCRFNTTVCMVHCICVKSYLAYKAKVKTDDTGLVHILI